MKVEELQQTGWIKILCSKLSSANEGCTRTLLHASTTLRWTLLDQTLLSAVDRSMSCDLQKIQRAWWCLGGPSSSWWPTVSLPSVRWMSFQNLGKSTRFILPQVKSRWLLDIYDHQTCRKFLKVSVRPSAAGWGLHDLLLEALQILHLRLGDGLHRTDGLDISRSTIGEGWIKSLF